MEEINIKEFLNYLKKFSVIIIFFAILCTTIVFVYDSVFKTPMYSTSTTIVLTKNEENESIRTSTDINDINLNQKLVATYRQIVKSKLVLNQVIDSLELKYSYKELYDRVDVTAADETEIIKIIVTDEKPENAEKIANKIASVFENEISKIYNMNNITVLDEADIPSGPSNNTLFRDIVLVIFASVAASVMLVFVVYYFDDTLRYNEELENELDMPIIAKVFKDDSNTELVVEKKPKSITSESIRNLRTNLQFSSVDEELKTILVTSTIPSEGKTYISSNLATSFAQASKRVLLIDCDLRKGRIHKIFKANSKKGLSNLLIHDIEDYPDYIVKTKIDNLFVMSRGTVPPNPSELLNSKKYNDLLNKLKKVFDIIILDGAPCSGLSDSLIISSIADKTIIVSSNNYTPKTELKNIKKSLDNVGAHVVGCVVNYIKVKKGTYGQYYHKYGYGYGYTYTYGEEENTKEPKSK